MRIAQHYGIFRHVANHRQGYCMNIYTLLVVDITIRPCWLHRIYSCNKSSLWVGRISVLYYILKGNAYLLISALLKPICQTTAIEITSCYALIFYKHRHQVGSTLCNEITLGINYEGLVFEEWRGLIHQGTLAHKPTFHLLIFPSCLGVYGGKTFNNHPYSLRQCVNLGYSALVLVFHDCSLTVGERTAAIPQGEQGDTKRIKVGGWRQFHHTVNNVGIHFRRGIYRSARLGSAMKRLIVLHY